MIPEKEVDALIVGGGPAGLSAALGLKKCGIDDILILEREKHAGGILRQCIHDGFGLMRFGMSLSGPEYAARFIEEAEALSIPCRIGTTVLSISPDRVVTCISPGGLDQYRAKAVILAMGCRERTRGALAIPGERPAGVFTAGVVQAYMNLYNRMPAREAVILGSGDIGMIMARRLTLEGAHVKGVYEIMPYAAGLPRNIEQCLHDYDIPLHLSHTVTKIHGKDRLRAVTVSRVDERLRPIAGTEREIPCDTLVLSVGLIPENELSLGADIPLDPRTGGPLVDQYCMTGLEGVFAAGNVLHVHDLADYVSEEAEALSKAAARYIRTGSLPPCPAAILCGESAGHVVPQRAEGPSALRLSLRVTRPMKKCRVSICQDGREVFSQRLPRAIPAEMIRLDIPEGTLSSCRQARVCVFPEEEETGKDEKKEERP